LPLASETPLPSRRRAAGIGAPHPQPIEQRDGPLRSRTGIRHLFRQFAQAGCQRLDRGAADLGRIGQLRQRLDRDAEFLGHIAHIVGGIDAAPDACGHRHPGHGHDRADFLHPAAYGLGLRRKPLQPGLRPFQPIGKRRRFQRQDGAQRADNSSHVKPPCGFSCGRAPRSLRPTISGSASPHRARFAADAPAPVAGWETPCRISASGADC